MSVLDILAKKNIIRKEDVHAIQADADREGVPVEDVLKQMGVSDYDVLEARGEEIKVPTRRIEDGDIPGSILAYILQDSAMQYKFVPLGVSQGVLEVGMVNPDNIEAMDALNFISSRNKMPFKVFMITPGDFEKVFEMYKGLTGQVTRDLDYVKETDLPVGNTVDLTDVVNLEEGSSQGKTITTIIEEAPVSKAFNTILRYAIEGLASDIHIEPLAESVRVRFRVDGVLHTTLRLPKKFHEPLAARIKVLCLTMKLDEKRKPQDGRFSAVLDGRKIDFRVSTFPTYYGEKVVMRILDQLRGIHKLDDMGIEPANLEILRAAIARPYGIILISGPTGSGKTTTLYALLNEIDREENNVLSLEDPIEFNIDGVSQSQVHPEIGYDFANGLRTTLRQDPDVIMVGEIRDKETAQLAVQAALTGHLVLSTIHTNNAVGVIPRLVDMGIDPFLIAPTLIIAVAQRLVRALAPGAAKAMPIDPGIKMSLEKEISDLPEKYRKQLDIPKDVYEPQPTEESATGLKGRKPVFEIVKMDKDLEESILKNATELDLLKVLRSKGFLTLKEDAMMKAFRGEIPWSEINLL